MKERSDASFIWGVRVSLMCVTDGLGRNIQVVLVKKKGSKQASRGGCITLFALCRVSA